MLKGQANQITNGTEKTIKRQISQLLIQVKLAYIQRFGKEKKNKYPHRQAQGNQYMMFNGRVERVITFQSLMIWLLLRTPNIIRNMEYYIQNHAKQLHPSATKHVL